MNAFNRFLVMVLAVVSFVVAGAVLLVAIGAIDADFVGGWFGDQMAEVDALGGNGEAIAIAASIGVMAVSLLLLLSELSPLWRKSTIVFDDMDGGRYAITEDSFEKIVQYSGSQVHGVNKVHPELSRTAAGLIVNLDAEIEPTANAPEAGAQLRERINEAVERMTGERVADVRMKMRVAKPKPAPRVT